MLSKLFNTIEAQYVEKILIVGVIVFACVFMVGAVKKKTVYGKGTVLWTKYWEINEVLTNFCSVSKNNRQYAFTVYKPTTKGNIKIYSYSTKDYFAGVFPEYSITKTLNTYWISGEIHYLRVFEYNPQTGKIKMTFETGYRKEPERFNKDNGESFLILGDESSFLGGNDSTLSYETALFYQRVPGKGYSEFTTCKWDDRYLMMDAINKQ
jgi:hypothetical protein